MVLKKVKAGINKGIISANVNVGTYLEIEKIKAKVSKELTGIQKSVNELGELVFEKWKQDSLDLTEVVTKCVEIQSKELLIESYNKEIKHLEEERDRILEKEKLSDSISTRICPACKASNYADSRFCVKCGTSLSVVTQQEDNADKTKLCSCGAVCNSTDKYCIACGKAL